MGINIVPVSAEATCIHPFPQGAKVMTDDENNKSGFVIAYTLVAMSGALVGLIAGLVIGRLAWG